MNDLNVVVKNGVNLFSSRLIAEATGKEHSNVVRDIKNMLEGLGLYDFHPSNLKDDDFKGFFINCKDYQGRKVVDEILLDKQLTMCLVTGYDVKQRMRVIKRVDELEERIKQLAAPQQQTQLIPGTPEHFNKCFTECFTQAYSSYFGKPAQTALTDQQQHTEPVEAVEEQKAIAGPALKHIEKPEDTISQNEMHAFISNDRLLEKLMEMVGLEIDRIHDPQVTPNGKHHQNPYPVYNKKEVYSMLKAAQSLCEELPASQKGHKRGKLLGIPFTMRKEIKKAKLWDGQLFDAARALFELYLEEEQTEQAE